jgi:hypothetical protein
MWRDKHATYHGKAIGPGYGSTQNCLPEPGDFRWFFCAEKIIAAISLLDGAWHRRAGKRHTNS